MKSLNSGISEKAQGLKNRRLGSLPRLRVLSIMELLCIEERYKQ